MPTRLCRQSESWGRLMKPAASLSVFGFPTGAGRAGRVSFSCWRHRPAFLPGGYMSMNSSEVLARRGRSLVAGIDITLGDPSPERSALAEHLARPAPRRPGDVRIGSHKHANPVGGTLNRHRALELLPDLDGDERRGARLPTAGKRRSGPRRGNGTKAPRGAPGNAKDAGAPDGPGRQCRPRPRTHRRRPRRPRHCRRLRNPHGPPTSLRIGRRAHWRSRGRAGIARASRP